MSVWLLSNVAAETVILNQKLIQRFRLCNNWQVQRQVRVNIGRLWIAFFLPTNDRLDHVFIIALHFTSPFAKLPTTEKYSFIYLPLFVIFVIQSTRLSSLLIQWKCSDTAPLRSRYGTARHGSFVPGGISQSNKSCSSNCGNEYLTDSNRGTCLILFSCQIIYPSTGIITSHRTHQQRRGGFDLRKTHR